MIEDPYKDWVIQSLALPGKSQTGLARHLGVDPSAINKVVHGKRLLKSHEVAAAALYFGTEAPQPVGEGRQRTRGQLVGSVIPGSALQTNRLMPVYSGAEGGAGKLIISLDPVDHVKLPASLENVSGAYGLLIDGVSMSPAFEPGDTALVNPHLRPQRGRNVILYHTPPDGQEAEAIVKRLNGWNDREWDLEQYNPPLKFKEFRQEWPICHRVVGKYEAQ